MGDEDFVKDRDFDSIKKNDNSFTNNSAKNNVATEKKHKSINEDASTSISYNKQNDLRTRIESMRSEINDKLKKNNDIPSYSFKPITNTNNNHITDVIIIL